MTDSDKTPAGRPGASRQTLPTVRRWVLSINGGSSSVKFAAYALDAPLTRLAHGSVERIGLPDAALHVVDDERNRDERREIGAADHRRVVNELVGCIEAKLDLAGLAAVGHRVVHGGPRFGKPLRVTPEVMNELRRLSPLDPAHLPAEIELIESFGAACPAAPQVVCFDTSFHRNMPSLARLLPIPRRYDAAGVRRYGFHGISYTYLMEELNRVAGREAADGRVVLAHLGSGASLAAVRHGRSIDTSMGFTPTAGVMMGTRSGDLDPGLLVHWLRSGTMTVDELDDLLNRQSGLRGVSETSSDWRDLLRDEIHDVRAAEAIALFCYLVKKWIGAFAAALGALDTLVFAGGIGEHSPQARERICAGLEFLGVRLDSARNAQGAPVISVDGGRATVRVIATDEERMIARWVRRVLDEG